MDLGKFGGLIETIAPTIVSGQKKIKKDLSGKKFGRLLVVGGSTIINSKRHWQCLCDCGNDALVYQYRLEKNLTTSCGCRKKETSLENCKKHGIKPTHGMSKSKAYKTWSSMIERCNPKNKRTAYVKNYSSRGIVVCDRWQLFENFYSDMGDPPKGLTLDRIDVNGSYSPENCRWATAKTQQNNRQNTRYLNLNGKKIALMDFADQYGIKKNSAQSFYSVLKILSATGIKVTVWEN